MRSTEYNVVLDEQKTNSGKKYKSITDIDTGEIIKDWWEEERDNPTGRPIGNKPHFIKMYRTNWRDVVANQRMTPYEQYVFTSLFAFLGWDGPLCLHPVTKKPLSEIGITQLLCASRPKIRLALDGLVDKGFVSRESMGIGKANHYSINTNIGFFGNLVLDKLQNVVFNSNCKYKPPVIVKYRQKEKK